ncbi:zinc finger protein 117 [Culex quinquefasciatus]|uniref:zinc finger protein 117 n=1 Tax=Culex quinquefasciatus TaxID=7176 RepID=UPI0018E2FA90|nr:zinc finger protein 117 [Culex quinquefasciatus]
MFRQVLPETNGIEQIFIIKSEPVKEEEANDGSDPMVPEDVDQIKPEPDIDKEDDAKIENPSKDEPAEAPNFGVLDVIVKQEPEEDETSESGEDDVKSNFDTNDKREVDDDNKKKSNRNFSNKQATKRKRRRKAVEDKSDSNEERFICKLCGKELSTQFNLERHAKGHERDKGKLEVIKRFVCHYCPNKFSTLFNLQRHEESHESKIPIALQVHKKKEFYCYVCGHDYETKDRIHEHLYTHADLLPYTCKECDKSVNIKSVRVLNQHLELHKETQTGSIKCLYCPARFHSLKGCQIHERVHIDGSVIAEAELRAQHESNKLNVKVIVVDGLRRYACDYCEKSYTLLATLRKHTNSHTLDKIYPCQRCGKTFDRASSLTLHEKVHSDFAPYKCETCGKGFKATIRLIQHRRIHTGERPFVCHCGMAFRKKFVLTVHEKNCVLPDSSNGCICRFCQMILSGYADLIKHVTELHTQGLSETRCQFCSAKFKNAIPLVIHEYRHQLPNVIKCETCNRIFKNDAHLKKHKRVHMTEPESFMCETCGKTFGRSVCLRNHKSIHTGKRKHKCDLCSKSFLVLRNMRRHRDSHFKVKSKYFIPSLRGSQRVAIGSVESPVKVNCSQPVSHSE